MLVTRMSGAGKSTLAPARRGLGRGAADDVRAHCPPIRQPAGYCAALTLLMLKSDTRTGGIAVRVK